MKKRPQRFRATALVVALATSACSGAATNPAAAPAPPPPPSDDDYAAAEPVPMSILDEGFVTKAEQRLNAAFALASGGAVVPPQVPAAFDPLAANAAVTPESLAFVVNRTNVPTYALQAALASMAEMRVLLSQEFSAAGRFGARDESVPVVDGKGQVTRRFPAPVDVGGHAVEFVRLEVDKTVAPTRYRVAYFAPSDATAGATSAALSRVFSATFERHGGGGSARVSIERLGRPGSSPSVTAMSYDAAEQTLKLSLGSAELAREDGPARTSVFVRLVGEDAVQVEGGYLWRSGSIGNAASDVLALPRSFRSLDGDVDLFAARVVQSEGIHLVAQKLAYVAAEQAVEAAKLGFAQILSAYDHAVTTRPFLIALLRHPGIDPGCSALGKSLREGALGPLAAALPDDLCASNAAVADTTVFDAMIETCEGKVDAVIPVRRGDGRTDQIHWCVKATEFLLLESPQFLTLDAAGTRSLVFPADAGLGALARHVAPADEYANLLEQLSGSVTDATVIDVYAASPALVVETRAALEAGVK